MQFLLDLSDKLDPLVKSDLQALLRLKEDEVRAAGEPFDGVINMWDLGYYQVRCWGVRSSRSCGAALDRLLLDRSRSACARRRSTAWTTK
jgi:hypothetical protein